MNPQFPIYIASYKRWDSRLTVKALDSMKVPYKVIVDKIDYDKYANVIPEEKLLALPPEYREQYDTFDKSLTTTGAGAARNFAWDHSISVGASHHWVMDDNFQGFWRLNRNIEARLTSGTGLKVMEDFVLRYDNIALSGPNYEQFVVAKKKSPPFVKNTRIYSCLLIRNDIPFRWRGTYNEDTDLSLRVLKGGWATIQFNAFLVDKITTQRLKGGNQEEFYSKEGTKPKSQMLADMHPDVAEVVWKFNRWHHKVNYKPFANNSLGNCSHIPTYKVNNYGMKLVKFLSDNI